MIQFFRWKLVTANQVIHHSFLAKKNIWYSYIVTVIYKKLYFQWINFFTTLLYYLKNTFLLSKKKIPKFFNFYDYYVIMIIMWNLNVGQQGKVTSVIRITLMLL